MIKYVPGCVGCGKPCIGSACKYHTEMVLVCDLCGDEVEDLYWADDNHDEQLCESCLLQRNRVEV